MRAATDSAGRLAARLAGNPKIERVFYPALVHEPEQRALVERQCQAAGAMLSIELGSKRAAFDFLRAVRLARNAVSLGGVETLVCHPRSTTHSGFTEEEFEQAGVTDGLVRISVGLEDWRDLAADFEQALSSV
jgi:cystathionine beta-lyase/cystathionine gamma-synthase